MAQSLIHHKGRGSLSNATGRYEAQQTVPVDDGWTQEAAAAPRTELQRLADRTVISRNRSPDVPFEQSVNPYRGCEHGCIYCYARPTHAWLGLSAGLDFETRLFYKPDTAWLLRNELAKPRYRCSPIALGSNTDPYQPVEKRLRITRSILETLHECRHPVTIVTKGDEIERDIDLLARMAKHNLVAVMISVTTLSDDIKRSLEPRAASPQRRLKLIEELSRARIPSGVLIAPVIPALTDHELESILEKAVAAGARAARYLLLRLPLEVHALFDEWLRTHHPAKRERVFSLLRQSHRGQVYASQFGRRGRGEGAYAEMLEGRFALACKRLALGDLPELDTTRFRPPHGPQLALF